MVILLLLDHKVGAWCVISAPLYLGFDLRNETTLKAMWPIISNREAIAINQRYAGHPGMLVKSWTPTIPKIKEFFVTTGSLGHTGAQKDCQTGWKYEAATQRVTTPTPSSVSGPHCLAFIIISSEYGATIGKIDDDSAIVSKPCNHSDPSQRWKSVESPGKQTGYVFQAVNAPSNFNSLYVDQWYAGARVKLASKGTEMHFSENKAGSTLTDGLTLPNDVCLNVWPTSGGGEALQLWIKRQPDGAVAVFLLNNHESNTYTNVRIPLTQVGLANGVTVKVRDIWGQSDHGVTTSALMLTVAPRDSRFMLLTPR